MTNYKTESLSIVAGPSKWDLATTFFNRKPMSTPKITFSAQPLAGGKKTPLLAMIDSIGAEDSSGESWNLTGRCYVGIDKLDSHVPPPPRKFTAYFRTDARAGYIEFVD